SLIGLDNGSPLPEGGEDGPGLQDAGGDRVTNGDTSAAHDAGESGLPFETDGAAVDTGVDAPREEGGEAVESDAPLPDGCTSPRTFYFDNDKDGYGGTSALTACEPPSGQWVTSSGDCDDNNATVNPGVTDYFTTGYTP